MKIFGIIPARMGSSRFPGKPLFKIADKPMIEHVYRRASLYKNWDQLILTTCDQEIEDEAQKIGIPCKRTGSHHVRALDRVAEAYHLIANSPDPNDIVVNVQGDEPMLDPEMLRIVIDPLLENNSKVATVLAIDIADEELWLNPDTVKIVHNDMGEILYTSRAPLPYANNGFSKDLGAKRVGGIFAFRWKYLEKFTNFPETRLEKLESCDSNRVLDMDFRQYIASYPAKKIYSVDSPSDIQLVEDAIRLDPIWNLYN